MADESTPRRRKLNTPQIERVLEAIDRGEYDERLPDFLTALNKRREVMQRGVLEQVRTVFGEKATVVYPTDTGTGGNRSRPAPIDLKGDVQKALNPFMQKAAAQQDEESAEPRDALSDMDDEQGHLEVKNDLPIERRGAEISGLSSSMIGD